MWFVFEMKDNNGGWFFDIGFGLGEGELVLLRGGGGVLISFFVLLRVLGMRIWLLGWERGLWSLLRRNL